MKKFLALLCLFVLLSVPPAFAADPFDVHEGGFGPKIKGLQVGMPMTLRQMTKMMMDTLSIGKFAIRIHDINGFSENKNNLELRYMKEKDGHIRYKLDDSQAYRSFEGYDKDGAIFDEVEKRGYAYVNAYGYISSHDNRNYPESDYLISVKIYTNHKRVTGFKLDDNVFGADSMSFEEFAQSLRNAYPLPPLEKDSDGNYEGNNRSEGWLILIGHDNQMIMMLQEIPEFN